MPLPPHYLWIGDNNGQHFMKHLPVTGNATSEKYLHNNNKSRTGSERSSDNKKATKNEIQMAGVKWSLKCGNNFWMRFFSFRFRRAANGASVAYAAFDALRLAE